ncbi:MAG: BON domain-containing protein [Bryobacteraceae bacterium]
MRRKFAWAWAGAVVALSLACTSNDQERAREKAAEAKQKTRQGAERARQELKKMGQAAKREAKKLDRNVNEALQGGQPDSQSAAGAERKLNDAGRELRTAGENAAVKLDRAAMLAKVKARLAADVGLSVAASVDVDSSGQVVTLRGTVSSEEQKQQAERAVMQVNGVTRVINLLQVKP